MLASQNRISETGATVSAVTPLSYDEPPITLKDISENP